MGILVAQVFREARKPPYYFGLICEQIWSIGVGSLPLVLITALATGSVMALQFGYGVAKFGGKLYVPKVVALTILREMGPVFTSLLVAGRIGSGITSEVASMKISQQLDAMRALGTSPTRRIVTTRIIAALISVPLLTLFSDYVGLLGAMLVCKNELGIHTSFFIAKCIETIRISDFLAGMAKTVVFAFFIALTACWRGLETAGGTEGVGRSTTWTVVTTSIFIMISDFFLTKFLIMTGFQV